MSLVSDLKSWFTLPEAAQRIAEQIGELFVDEVDLLQVALEGQLSLSVVFPDGVLASLCVPVDENQIEYEIVPSLDGTRSLQLPKGGPFVYTPSGTAMRVEDRIFELETDWPYALAMIGGEFEDLKLRFWHLSRINREETTSLNGTFVSEIQNGSRKYFQLQGRLPRKPGEGQGYFPLGSLPKNAVLVLTRENLNSFVERIKLTKEPTKKGAASHIPPATKWPWGNHHTELLGHLEAAASRFWVNFDPTDTTTATTNEEVSAWLERRGVSKRAADAIATILRANGLPTGPRKGS